MSALEVLALDPLIPQIRAVGLGDTYTFPRPVAMATPLGVSSGGTGTSTPTLVAGTNISISGTGQKKPIKSRGGGGGGGGPVAYIISTKTIAYTVIASDLGAIINSTSASNLNISLTSAVTLGVGFYCWIWNNGTAVALSIIPSGVETIDGTTVYILHPGQGIQVVSNGTNWETGDLKTLRTYSEYMAASSTRPNATGIGSVAIGIAASTSSSGSSAVAIGRGAQANGLYAATLGAFTSATGQGSIALGYGATAAGIYSTAIGAGSTAVSATTGASAQGGVAIGAAYVNGNDAFAAAITNNTSTYGATGATTVAIGGLAKASVSSAIAIGYLANATSSGSIALAGSGTGWGCDATAPSAIAIGDGAVSAIKGKFAFSSGSSATGKGTMQAGMYILSVQTTTTTPATLNSYNYIASDATNQVVLPNNSAFAFTGTVIARQQASGGTASAAWKIEGLIRRDGTAATTTLVASTVTAISNVPGWTLALAADTTNGCLSITATGAAATNIRWVATVQTSEVIYA